MSVSFTPVDDHENIYDVHGDETLTRVTTRPGMTAEEAYAEVKAEPKPVSDYRDERHARYPAIRDQLDAISKMVEALIAQGFSFPPDVEAWVSTIRQIKAEFPKN